MFSSGVRDSGDGHSFSFLSLILSTCVRSLVCFSCCCFLQCSRVYKLSLRFQHAPQQQQLVNGDRRSDPRRGRGKARNDEEVGSQHLQGSYGSVMMSVMMKYDYFMIHLCFRISKISKPSPVCSWCLCVSSVFCFFLVYEANYLGAFRSGFPDRGPGARGPDRGAERHEEEIWECAAIGQSADQPLLQHGADPACTGGHLRWPQSEVSRAAGEL